jgi:hypothetical protein
MTSLGFGPMQPLDHNLREARIMGLWRLDMDDRNGAQAAIDSLPATLRAAIEVRRSIWGAQVTTENDAAALWVKDHYTPSPLVLAA